MFNLEETAFAGDDYKILLFHILTQAMDDYVKLQHPKSRNKEYLQEAFDDAVDMFFDKQYSMLLVPDSEGKPITLKSLFQELIEDDTVALDKLKGYVIEQAYEYWNKRELNVVVIPESFIYQGHVYQVFHSEDEDEFEIDFKAKTITLNKENNTDNQEKFIQAMTQVVFYHEDVSIAPVKLAQVGKGIFQALRMNTCFIGE